MLPRPDPRPRIRCQTSQSDSGQIIVMVALAAIVMFAIIGLAVDVGRLYITKAELSRAVDAAALAGVADLDGTNDAGACDTATAYFQQNEGGADAAVTSCTVSGSNQLRVAGQKSVDMRFIDILPGVPHSVSVGAHAVANYGVQNASQTSSFDAAMLLDATGSMSGNKIDQAKIAAQDFTDELLGGSNPYIQVGLSVFRGCFRSSTPKTIAPMSSSKSYCANYDSQVKYLTSTSSQITSIISNVDAQGGSGTNVCGALVMGGDILNGPNNQSANENYHAYLILLSDGNNVYNSYSYKSTSPRSPYDGCRPTGTSPYGDAATSDNDVSSDCNSVSQKRRAHDYLDPQTLAEAEQLKAAGVTIYVVGFEVCGSSDSTTFTPAECDAQVGVDSASDNTADRRLLKCIASSTSGTNDHYWETSNASDLPGIFTQIAKQIGALHLVE